MENSSNNEFSKFVKDILGDYALTCGVETFDGEIIISDDLANAYTEIRNDLVENGSTNLDEIQKYHGLTVQPKNISGTFTILLNRDYIIESISNDNIDWVGTLVHEAVHVNDFKDYFGIVSPESYDELYDYNKHRMFLHWTEFHARAIGHYFLRKYTLQNFKDPVYIEYIMNTELPFHINYMADEVAKINDADRQMYVIMHFLGRIAVWQHLYPTTFDSSFIHQLTNSNPWMEELYDLLIKYDTLEDMYSHFDDMEDIFNKHFSEI